MRLKYGVALLATAGLLANTRVDVSQLVASLTSDLATDRNDRRIARSLKSVRLTDRLTAETAGLLVKMGVGAETARELDALRKQSAKLPLPAHEPLATAPVPSASERQEIIDRMRRYVSAYLAGFPDFIATKEMRQYHNYRLLDKPDFYMNGETGYRSETSNTTTTADRWYPAGTFTGEAAYAAGHTYYNNPAAGQKHTIVSHGEFGGMMEEIFDASRGAQFTWDRWQMLDGTLMAVLAYFVTPELSRYAVCCRPGSHGTAKAGLEYVRTGHRGFIFVDPQTGRVMRLILYAADSAQGSNPLAAGHVLDYGPVTIGANHYILPVRSTAFVRIGEYESREEIEYRNYRKFSSEAAINFSEDPGAETKH